MSKTWKMLDLREKYEATLKSLYVERRHLVNEGINAFLFPNVSYLLTVVASQSASRVSQQDDVTKPLSGDPKLP